MSTKTGPRLAMIPGDPGGIGPELIAKLLHEDGVGEACDILLIGDGHVFRRGGAVAGLDVPLDTITENAIAGFTGIKHLEMATIDEGDIRIAEVTEAGGASCLRTLDKALDLAMAGLVDGILFAPFNKASMTAAGMDAEDEHRYMARYIGFTGYHSEINVLDDLMTTRVTSHIALKDVAAHITADGVIKAVELAAATLKKSGNDRPHIAVAALNPHAGDNGKFGTEEIDILTPAIAACTSRQMHVTGPWPSDTVFLKAKAGEVDAVVTMYHDQGQIAVKLLGFDRGVTVAGGLPIAVATPAHGTAFDIAGKNKANIGATRKAYDLLTRMASRAANA